MKVILIILLCIIILFQCSAYAHDDLINHDGVVSVGTGINGLVVGVLEGYDYQGLLNDDIEIVVYSEHPSFLYMDKHRPIPPGVRVDTETASGSVGFFITEDDSRYMISAAHVIGHDWLKGIYADQYVYYQNTRSILNKIGVSDRMTHAVNGKDGIAVKVYDGVEITNTLLEPHGLSITGYGTPYLGKPVIKVGSRTGLSEGYVTQIDVSLDLGGLILRDLIQYETFATHGDSGGVILTQDGKILAITSAGSHADITKWPWIYRYTYGHTASDICDWLDFGPFPELIRAPFLTTNVLYVGNIGVTIDYIRKEPLEAASIIDNYLCPNVTLFVSIDGGVTNVRAKRDATNDEITWLIDHVEKIYGGEI